MENHNEIQSTNLVYVKSNRILSKIGIKDSSLSRDLIRDKYLYLLLLPFVAWYVIFAYMPMWGLQIAFKDYSVFKGIVGSPWVGFENFLNYFTGPYFIRTLCNTIIINVYGIVFGFPAPIILALLLNEVRNVPFKKTIQTVTLLPYFISIVVIAGMVINFLSPSSGVVNIIIERLGGTKINFLIKPEYFRAIFTSMNIWIWVGYGSIIYTAALAGIDVELYESAVIDGANKWRQLFHITIPGIMPTVAIMFIIAIGNLLNVGYEAIILLYQPVTYETADVISTYVYRSGIIEGHYAIASAAGFFNSIVALLLVFLANKLSKKTTGIGIW